MLFRNLARLSSNKNAQHTPVTKIFSLQQGDPVELLLTRYLQKAKAPPAALLQTAPTQKSQDFILARSKYSGFAQENPQGSIINAKHKGLNLTFVSTNYGWPTPIGSAYKLLLNDKPDLIMAQVRPDKMLPHFRLITKSRKDDTFSDREYWKQICRTGFEVMPSNKYRSLIESALKKSKIGTKELAEDYKAQYKAKIAQHENSLHSEQHINDQLLSTVCYFSQRSQIPLALCSLPEISQRQHLANSNTLMQLQVIFKQTCQQLPMYRQETSPRRIAEFLFPEVFHYYNDRYMATLLQYLAAVGKYKRIVMFVGLVQGRAIREYLQNRSMSTIFEDMYPPKPNGSLMRDIENFEIIEKHCLLDVLQYGKAIATTPMNHLQTTNVMLNFYANPENKDPEEAEQRMEVFRIKMYAKYIKMLEECEQVGEALKKKEFMRMIL